MILFKELKCNLKKEDSNHPSFKIELVGDTATQFLAIAIKGMGVDRVIMSTSLRQSITR